MNDWEQNEISYLRATVKALEAGLNSERLLSQQLSRERQEAMNALSKLAVEWRDLTFALNAASEG